MPDVSPAETPLDGNSSRRGQKERADEENTAEQQDCNTVRSKRGTDSDEQQAGVESESNGVYQWLDHFN